MSMVRIVVSDQRDGKSNGSKQFLDYVRIND